MELQACDLTPENFNLKDRRLATEIQLKISCNREMQSCSRYRVSPRLVRFGFNVIKSRNISNRRLP